MFFENVSILGLANEEAPHIITSQSIEAELQTNMERLGMRPNLIQELTGIEERRFWDPGVQPSDVASQAGAKALAHAGIDKGKIGVLISTSVSKDYIEPSVASLVHGNLGLPPECLNFDIGNACLAFLNGMQVAGNMIEREQIDYALIVNGESSRYITEETIKRLKSPDCDLATFRDSFATLTLGSGASAMVLGRSSLAPDGHRFLGGVSLAATEYSRLCLGQVNEMKTDASTLLKAGIQLANQTYRLACDLMGWSKVQFDHYIMHQVGETHIRKLCEFLKLPIELVYKIYPKYGNIGPVSIPYTLNQLNEKQAVNKGDRIALMGIGSGINCAMMEVIW